MTTTPFTLEEIYQLAHRVFIKNGCNQEHADALSRTVMTAERDGSTSHGLFRVPGYVAALRSGKVNGKATIAVNHLTPVALQIDGGNGYAPLALEQAAPPIGEAAKQYGVAIGSFVKIHHFAALWPEVERLAEMGLVALACTAYMPSVAPAGATAKFFGTNPIAFAWPRPGKNPMVFDMATANRAMGDVQMAARDGHELPDGTGLDKAGHPTNDPHKVIDGGVLLPFGGYKGSAISMMVELLAAGVTGDHFSYEAGRGDNKDGGPPQGGEFILAINPEVFAGKNWQQHADEFFTELIKVGVKRLPGDRRHQNRQDTGTRSINTALVEKIEALL